MTLPIALHAPLADLLARARIDARIEAIAACAHGGNNRIYRVTTTAGQFAVKQYFRHEGDSRDRLAAEYAFLTYANVAAPGATPRPFSCNPELGIALYEFVDGSPFRAGATGVVQVDAAIRFFQALNAPSRRTTAQLPAASEACFSIAAHLALIGARIDRLLDVAPQSDVDSAALDFFKRLDRFWRELAERIQAAAGHAGLDVDAPLMPEQRCISPSDFGFHNALAEMNGNVRFLDFEYAGWDDPAKTAGDFFAQLAVPVPDEYYDRFVAESMRMFPEPAALVLRARLLRTAYRIKWCCIALNVFMPVHLARRRFADPGVDEAALKQAQLAKAQQIFQSIQAKTHGLH